MLCQNPTCRKPIDEDSTFCFHCGSSQSDEQPTVIKSKPVENFSIFGESTGITTPATQIFPGQDQPLANRASISQSQNLRYIEFRASANIWNFTEQEPYVPPEQRRPVLILDEQTILLSETDKKLTPEELLARVQAIIQQKQVPVQTYIAHAGWIYDYYERRPRIIAELKDHAYSGLKMVLGLDYMGNWATLQFQIGIQPDPIPKPPPSLMSANQIPQLFIIGGIIGGVIGLFMLLGGLNARDGAAWIMFGLLFLVAGTGAFIYGFQQNSQVNQEIETQRKQREQYEREQYQQALYKARMELYRTYKIDDAMLFREAMDKVFKQVVDDIIEQGGGKIVKEIKGGEDSMFDMPTDSPAGTQQKSDQQSLGDKAKTAAKTVATNKIKKELGIDI